MPHSRARRSVRTLAALLVPLLCAVAPAGATTSVPAGAGRAVISPGAERASVSTAPGRVSASTDAGHASVSPGADGTAAGGSPVTLPGQGEHQPFAPPVRGVQLGTPLARTLTLKALAFQSTNVVATSGTATDTLTWNVTDTAPGNGISGQIDLRMRSASGSYVGGTRVVAWGPAYAYWNYTIATSGTSGNQSYRYAFPVPAYAATAKATWVVTEVSLRDGPGHARTYTGSQLAGFTGHFTATEKVDTTPPDVSADTYLQVWPGDMDGYRPYVDSEGAKDDVIYGFSGYDLESGVWKGDIVLTGPGGATLTTPFTLVQTGMGLWDCGDSGTGFGGADCRIRVALPPGTASGVWRATSVTMVDNAGNSATVGNVASNSVTVGDDKALSASDLTVSPAVVDNWVTAQPITFSAKVSDAREGVSDIYVDTSDSDNCLTQASYVPTAGQDGTVTVALEMAPDTTLCVITGIAIVDGSGAVALYGPEYGAPDPGLTVSAVPDTTPPAVTSASLSTTTISASDTSPVDLTLQMDDPLVPLEGWSTDSYDSTGKAMGLSNGGLDNGVLESTVTIQVFPPGVPGTYRVGFSLTDEGGLTATYGPGGLPMPGGDLTLTVTP